MHPVSVHEQAVAMRRARKSYSAITTALGIPKGTLSGWFNQEQWSKEIRRELDVVNREQQRAAFLRMLRERSAHFARLRAEGRREARESFEERMRDPLFATGVALYWGEGDKSVSRGRVRLANTDARMLQVFVRFLSMCCGVPMEKLRAWILLYPDLDREAYERYWSDVLDIPRTQFHRSQVIQGKSQRRPRLPHGVCTVSFTNCILMEQMDEWMRCLHMYFIRDTK